MKEQQTETGELWDESKIIFLEIDFQFLQKQEQICLTWKFSKQVKRLKKMEFALSKPMQLSDPYISSHDI